jgi:hypothetical protein
MKYIWNGQELVEVGEARRAPSRGPMIMRDTPGVVDPIHGGWLEGRSARREYMKVNEVREYDPGESPKKPVAPSWVQDWRAGRGIERSEV